MEDLKTSNMNGILIKGSYPITITQCTVEGRVGTISTCYAPISGFTKRFILKVKYGL